MEELPKPKTGESLPESKESKRLNYSISIYFSAHGSAEDIQGEDPNSKSKEDKFKRKSLAELFREADVYVPELHGWNDISLQNLQALSYGRITPGELLKEMYASLKNTISDPKKRKNFRPESEDPIYSFRKAELEMIFNSYKPIIFFDIPATSPKNEILRNHIFPESPERVHETDSFEKVLAKIKRDLRKTADLHNEREDYMLSQIDPSLQEVLKERPDLQKKPKIKVLMFLGSAHTRVAHMLSEYGLTIESHYSRLPHIFSYSNEIHRRFAHGKEVSNELAAKVLLEGLCENLLGATTFRFTQDTNEADAFIRKVVNLFNYEEIKDLFEIPFPFAVSRFFKYLEEKGVNPPGNRAEFLRFISESR